MAPPSVSRRATTAPAPAVPETGPLGFATLPALLCFGGLALWLLLAPMNWSGVWVIDANFGSQSLLAQSLVLLCGAGLTVLAAISRLHTPRFGAVAWLLTGFLGWMFVSVFTASYSHDAWLELARITGALVMFYLVRLFPSPSHRLALIAAAVVGLMWPCLYALWDFIHTHYARQAGSYQNTNWFANALAMGLPLALVLPLGTWSVSRQKGLTTLALVPLIVLLPGLAVTSSKGGFLAAAAALLVTVVALYTANPVAFKQTFRRFLPVIVVAFVVVGLLVAKTVGPRLMQARGSDDNSTQFRAYLWRGTVKMIEARPLTGHGPASFPDTYPRYAVAGYTRTAHESWLQIAAESGVPAVVLLLAATLCALAKGIKALKSSQWPLVAGALGAATALLVHGCFDAGWSTPSIVLLLAFALGLLDVPDGAEQNESQIKEGGLSWGWLGATLLLGVGGYGSQQAASGLDAYTQSQLAIKTNPSLALQQAQNAVATDPGAARNWNQLGKLQAGLQTGDWKTSLQKAVELQPNRPQNYHSFETVYENLGDASGVETYFQKTLDHDPLNTRVLLERAKWRLDHKDTRGDDDLEAILKLWNEPYGRYPALADWVNLDFARAVVLLAPRLQKSDSARLQDLVKHALADVAAAQAHQKQNQEVLEANGNDTSLDSNADVDTLETQLKALQSR